jgi:hypothetical protein
VLTSDKISRKCNPVQKNSTVEHPAIHAAFREALEIRNVAIDISLMQIAFASASAD